MQIVVHLVMDALQVRFLHRLPPQGLFKTTYPVVFNKIFVFICCIQYVNFVFSRLHYLAQVVWSFFLRV